MRIGILTQPLGHNYGGILQNYALQQALMQLGHEPITLRMSPNFGTFYQWAILCAKIIILKLLGRNVNFPSAPCILRMRHKKRYDKQEQFIKNNITTTKKRYVYMPKCIIKSQALDALIVGSDQVWRPMYNARISDMFLGFCIKSNIRRIAYAASFGVDSWEFTPEQTEECCNLINHFDAVSVREDSGVALCRDHLGCDAVEVLDPTLLLSKDKYASLCQSIPEPEEKQLVAYVLDMNNHKREIVEEIAAKRNLTVKYFSADTNAVLSVEEWIAAFRDAAFVVTDSFHGTVFSIIFNHDFYSFANEGRGASRFHSLLSKFGLADRIIANAELIEANSIASIDWSKVNAIHDSLKSDSIEFLRKNIN